MEYIVRFSMVLFLVCSQYLAAQKETRPLVWNTHELECNVPADFKITQNDSSRFAGGTENYTVSIIPCSKDISSYYAMKHSMQQWIHENGIISDVTDNKISDALLGLWGIMGAGEKDGRKAFLMLAVDEEKSTRGFFILITYTFVGFDDAFGIYTSIHTQ